jgi:hypothetical protein
MSTPALAPSETRIDRIVNAIRNLQAGRNNATGSCTLAASVATTTVTAPNCAPTSQVFLFPKTAHAGAELAAGGCYISTVGNGLFVITHANNAQIDRTFGYAALG